MRQNPWHINSDVGRNRINHVDMLTLEVRGPRSREIIGNNDLFSVAFAIANGTDLECYALYWDGSRTKRIGINGDLLRAANGLRVHCRIGEPLIEPKQIDSVVQSLLRENDRIQRRLAPHLESMIGAPPGEGFYDPSPSQADVSVGSIRIGVGEKEEVMIKDLIGVPQIEVRVAVENNGSAIRITALGKKFNGDRFTDKTWLNRILSNTEELVTVQWERVNQLQSPA